MGKGGIMTHGFDTEIAKKVGVNSAIILNHLVFWLEKNNADEVNFKMGRTWVYTTIQGLAKVFPYFSPAQIRYALNKLLEAKMIMVQQFGGHDRVNWYSLTDEAMSEYSQFQELKLADGRDKISSCIYNNNKVITKDISKDEEKFEKSDEFTTVNMTQAEYGKLIDKFGEDNVVLKLNHFEAYLVDHPDYVPKSHYLTLRKWLTKDVQKGFITPPKQARVFKTAKEYSNYLINEKGYIRDSVPYEQKMEDFKGEK